MLAMTIEQFWAQDRLTLSLQLGGIVFGVMAVAGLALRFKGFFQSNKLRLEGLLQSPAGVRIAMLSRFILAAAGAGTLIVTFLPGLMPFHDRLDPNLELGGLVFFFLWPLIAVQITIACLPLERYFRNHRLLLWLLLLGGGFVALSIDATTLRLMYN